MTKNRAFLSFAVVLTLPAPAAAQRFAGVMDATGMIARPTASRTVTSVPGFPTLLSVGTVFTPPVRGGFFTPGAVPQPVRTDTAALNSAVQPVFVPFPLTVNPAGIVAAEPLDAEALSPQESPSTTTFRIRGSAASAPAVVQPTVGSAIGRCQTAALRQLRASNIQAEDLRFDGNSTAMSTLNDAADVRGSGILLDRGRWRSFRYVCDYRLPPAQARAVVTLGPTR